MQLSSLKQHQRGFSLIELTVVLGIFLVVTSVSVSIFISMLSQEKRILAEQELINQTNYITQYVSDALRMATADKDGACLGQAGYVYALTHCSQTSLTCNGVKFINTLDNNACEEVFVDDTTNTLSQIKNQNEAQSLLSNKFYIKKFTFIVNGDKTARFASSFSATWPKITFLLNVISDNATNKEKIIQATVSQRNYPKP